MGFNSGFKGLRCTRPSRSLLCLPGTLTGANRTWYIVTIDSGKMSSRSSLKLFSLCRLCYHFQCKSKDHSIERKLVFFQRELHFLDWCDQFRIRFQGCFGLVCSDVWEELCAVIVKLWRSCVSDRFFSLFAVLARWSHWNVSNKYGRSCFYCSRLLAHIYSRM